jgi:hypothetical protein
MASDNPFLRTTPAKPKPKPPTRDEEGAGRTRIRRILVPGSQPGAPNPYDTPARQPPNPWVTGRQPTVNVGPAETMGEGKKPKPAAAGGSFGAKKKPVKAKPSRGVEAPRRTGEVAQRVNEYASSPAPRSRLTSSGGPRPGTPAAAAMDGDRASGVVSAGRRPSSSVIPVATLPAEPPPLRGPGDMMGGPDPAPARTTVLQAAQQWNRLPATPDSAGLAAADLASFRRNYRATHKSRLTPAQEMLMARYIYSQNQNNIMFGDPGTLRLGQ